MGGLDRALPRGENIVDLLDACAGASTESQKQ